MLPAPVVLRELPSLGINDQHTVLYVIDCTWDPERDVRCPCCRGVDSAGFVEIIAHHLPRCCRYRAFPNDFRHCSGFELQGDVLFAVEAAAITGALLRRAVEIDFNVQVLKAAMEQHRGYLFGWTWRGKGSFNADTYHLQD